MKRWTCVFVTFAFFLMASSAFAVTKTLKVGVYHNPPSVMLAADGSPQGLFVDLLIEIAKIEDWRLEYVASDWQTLLAKLKTGEIDLLTSISYSEERDRDYDFVQAPVSVKWGAVYLPVGSVIKTLPDLNRKRVAIQKGDIHGLNFIRISREFAIDPIIVETPSLKDVFQLIGRGEVDAGVVNNTFGSLEEEHYRVERSAIMFHPTRSTFAAPQGRHADVLAAIDAQLETWRKTPGSIYYQSYNRWYGGKEYVRTEVPRWLIVSLVSGLLGLWVIVLWNRKLGREINRRKALEVDLSTAKQAAETSNLAKSRFLAAASHDLRQPMQAISLFIDSLSRTSLSEEQKHITHCLEESSQSLGDLLNALLDISKLDAGAIKSEPTPTPVDILVGKIEAEFSTIVARKSLRFKLFFPFGGMALYTDAKLLMSLLGNLIGNAVKYTEQGGLLVAIRRRGTQALIQVWDTGRGIAPEHMNHIFEEYFQVENKERDRANGLGLGLAIAQRMAKLLGTEIVCRSRPGKGSVFEFRLPLATGGENAPTSLCAPPNVTHSAKPVGRHIVLVEDDPLVGTATKLALESSGMTVTHYKTAEEALADPDIAGADFYISDLRLPGKNGFEFLDALQQRVTKPVKSVVLTGDTAVNRIEMMRSTSWPVLFKPVDLASLLAAIEAQDLVQ